MNTFLFLASIFVFNAAEHFFYNDNTGYTLSLQLHKNKECI